MRQPLDESRWVEIMQELETEAQEILHKKMLVAIKEDRDWLIGANETSGTNAKVRNLLRAELRKKAGL